jgi:hypothetical protein
MEILFFLMLFVSQLCTEIYTEKYKSDVMLFEKYYVDRKQVEININKP